MTPSDLRDRIRAYGELLDDYDNFTALKRDIIFRLERFPADMSIIEASLGECDNITFTIPLSELVPLLTRRIEHFERKIGELK